MKNLKDKSKENKAYTFDAIKSSSTMVVSLLPKGKIMIQDYSVDDSRKELLKQLEGMGIKTATTLESLCG